MAPDTWNVFCLFGAYSLGVCVCVFDSLACPMTDPVLDNACLAGLPCTPLALANEPPHLIISSSQVLLREKPGSETSGAGSWLRQALPGDWRGDLAGCPGMDQRSLASGVRFWCPAG